MTLFSKTVAERTKPGQRQDVEEQGMTPSYNISQLYNSNSISPLQTTHSMPMAAPKASPAS
jgi:hypothetical protein